MWTIYYHSLSNINIHCVIVWASLEAHKVADDGFSATQSAMVTPYIALPASLLSRNPHYVSSGRAGTALFPSKIDQKFFGKYLDNTGMFITLRNGKECYNTVY